MSALETHAGGCHCGAVRYEARAINARCLEGVDVQKLNVTFFDGKDR